MALQMQCKLLFERSRASMLHLGGARCNNCFDASYLCSNICVPIVEYLCSNVWKSVFQYLNICAPMLHLAVLSATIIWIFDEYFMLSYLNPFETFYFVKMWNFKVKTLTGQLCNLIQRKCIISVTNVESIVEIDISCIFSICCKMLHLVRDSLDSLQSDIWQSGHAIMQQCKYCVNIRFRVYEFIWLWLKFDVFL